MQDPTLAEVGTHNALVSEDISPSCPPNFWASTLLDAHVPCLNMCNESGRMIVGPPLLWTDSIIHKTIRYQYLFENKTFVNNMSFTKFIWWHCIEELCTL